MPNRPRLKREGSKLPGLAAVALFVVLAAIFATSRFGDPAGLGDGSITASIGYALFNLGDLAAHETEGFLVAFIVVAVVLDAALDGSIMLAKREEESPFRELSRRVRADGGRDRRSGSDRDPVSDAGRDDRRREDGGGGDDIENETGDGNGGET